MMPVLSSLLALSLLSAGKGPSEQCVGVDATAIHADVQRALSARGHYALDDALGALEERWSHVCIESKRTAPRAIVTDVSRLFKIKTARNTAAEILFDTDDNLKAARKPLADAIGDQARIDRRFFKRAAPLIPSSGTFISDSLTCVMHKLETGNIDTNLCALMIRDRNPR